MRYALGSRTSNVTTGNAAYELIAGTLAGCRLVEFGITLTVATLSSFGIGFPAAKGITPTSPVTFLPEDAATLAPGTLPSAALAWGTGPTIPAQFYRRATFTGGITWTFGRSGLAIPANLTFIVWNLSTTQIADVWAVVEQ